MTPFTTGLTYDGIPLVVSGKRDAEDCWVERVCVAGTRHNIAEHLAQGVVDRIAELADAQVSRENRRAMFEAQADSKMLAFQLERFARHL